MHDVIELLNSWSTSAFVRVIISVRRMMLNHNFGIQNMLIVVILLLLLIVLDNWSFNIPLGDSIAVI